MMVHLSFRDDGSRRTLRARHAGRSILCLEMMVQALGFGFEDTLRAPRARPDVRRWGENKYFADM